MLVAEAKAEKGDEDDRDGSGGTTLVAFDVLMEVESGSTVDKADVNTGIDGRRGDDEALGNGAG